MAQPARRVPQAADTPPIDPDAVARAYRRERAKRRARLERSRERRLAGLRFAFVLLVLLALTIFLSLTIWKQIERLFGL
jgi:cell division septal protein FtsQ